MPDDPSPFGPDVVETFAEWRKRHGEPEATRVVCRWLRDMADAIEKDDMRSVFMAEKVKRGFADMTTLRVTTSLPWPG